MSISESLFNIYNNLGFTDLEICKVSNGHYFSKWQRYEDLIGKEIDFNQYSERTIADVEIIFDYDQFSCHKCHKLSSTLECKHCGKTHSKEDQKAGIFKEFKYNVSRMARDGIKFKAYRSGGKGFHCVSVWPNLRKLNDYQRERFKERLISKYNAEELKKGKKCLITIEGSNHRKSGQKKELLFCREGWNYGL